MDAYSSDRIRNVALVGGSGGGKTSLAEAIMVTTGAISRAGKIEDGSTVSDFDPLEISHKHSLSLSLLASTWNDYKINLIDTPGISDFISEVLVSFAVCEIAVFVISATDEIGPDTMRLWNLAHNAKLPRLIFLNKFDKERANFDDAMSYLRESFDPSITPLDLPLGQGGTLSGVADLLLDDAITYEDGEIVHSAIPEELTGIEHVEHEHLVEGIVLNDETLMEQYLDGTEPPPDILERVLATEVLSGEVFPVICGSATKNIGVDQLLRFLVEVGPPPATSSASLKSADTSSSGLAQIFKTVIDPYLGRVSFLKAFQGTLTSDETLTNVNTHHDERLHSIMTRRGKESIPVKEVHDGDIFVASKLNHTRTGDTLAKHKSHPPLPDFDIPKPSHSVICNLKNPTDDEKAFVALMKVAEEDLSLVVDREPRTNKIRLMGLGDLHVHNAIERIAQRHQLEVSTSEPKIEYLATIRRPAKAEGRVKKQSGGHGQFAVVNIAVRPLPRGVGFRFIDHVVGGAVPRGFIPAVEKGIIEAMETGDGSDYPVVDVEVELYDGKFHAVDSSEYAFKLAGSLAFKAAFEQGEPLVLEPIAELSINVPTQFHGDVLSDLQGRSAKIQSTETPLGMQMVCIRALVGESKLQRYAIDLRSMTSGQGTFHCERSHYEPVQETTHH